MSRTTKVYSINPVATDTDNTSKIITACSIESARFSDVSWTQENLFDPNVRSHYISFICDLHLEYNGIYRTRDPGNELSEILTDYISKKFNLRKYIDFRIKEMARVDNEQEKYTSNIKLNNKYLFLDFTAVIEIFNDETFTLFKLSL